MVPSCDYCERVPRKLVSIYLTFPIDIDAQDMQDLRTRSLVFVHNLVEALRSRGVSFISRCYRAKSRPRYLASDMSAPDSRLLPSAALKLPIMRRVRPAARQRC